MKNIVILGSTGSIGTQALDIVSRLPGQFNVLGLAANGNTALLAQQALHYGAKHVSIGGANERYADLKARLSGSGIKVHQGIEGMCTLSTLDEVELVVVAVAGAVGIMPTHAAIEAGKNIALASKEVLVAAGEHTMRLAKRKGVTILPIDSEHSALFQCLQGAPENSVEKLLLTASGGPFRSTPNAELANVTPEQALKHPTWTMGGLVTINSATLFNKGLEIIEAQWLFDMNVDDVEVVVHPQSIIHSMIRYKDGSTIAQLGLPDMRLPIQYALVYPERLDSGLPRFDITQFATLTFEKPDEDKFPALRLAKQSVKQGGTMPAVMNAANEVAVGLFLERKLSYTGIMDVVQSVMEQHSVVDPSYQNVLAADAWAREIAENQP